MPLLARVHTIGGELLLCNMLPSDTIRTLRYELAQHLGVQSSMLRFFVEEKYMCRADTGLLALAGWCVIADLLDPMVLSNVLIEVTLTAVVCGDECYICEAPRARRCGQCRLVRYCSRACQSQDWRRHRSECQRSDARQ
jgi:hypothetical protein